MNFSHGLECLLGGYILSIENRPHNNYVCFKDKKILRLDKNLLSVGINDVLLSDFLGWNFDLLDIFKLTDTHRSNLKALNLERYTNGHKFA